MDHRATLREVAAAAGVSPATASMALRGLGAFLPETRERIHVAAARLNYLPDPAALTLRRGSPRTIGVVIRSLRRPGDAELFESYWSAAIFAGALAAFHHGYALTLLPSDHLEVFTSTPLSALIIGDPDVGDPFLDAARALRLPTVTPLPQVPLEFAATVDVDAAEMTFQACEALVRAGSTHIALITLRDTSVYAQQTLSGYRRWCTEAGIAECVEHCDDAADIAKASARMVEDTEIDGIVSAAAGLAAVLETAEFGSREIGRDLHIAVVDPQEDVLASRLPVWQVITSPKAVGRTAVDTAVALTEGRIHLPHRTILEAMIIPPHPG